MLYRKGYNCTSVRLCRLQAYKLRAQIAGEVWNHRLQPSTKQTCGAWGIQNDFKTIFLKMGWETGSLNWHWIPKFSTDLPSFNCHWIPKCSTDLPSFNLHWIPKCSTDLPGFNWHWTLKCSTDLPIVLTGTEYRNVQLTFQVLTGTEYRNVQLTFQ